MVRMSLVPHPPPVAPVAVVTAVPMTVVAQILPVAHPIRPLHQTIACIIAMIQVTRQIPIIPSLTNQMMTHEPYVRVPQVLNLIRLINSFCTVSDDEGFADEPVLRLKRRN